MLAALLLVCALSAAPAPTEVKLAWEYEGMPPGLRVLEAVPATPELWTTEVADSRERIPAGRELPGGVVRLKPGEERTLVLVYHNTGKTPLRFFAAPHAAKPAAASLGLEFECLCLNHVYSVGPGRWWWRVVRLSLSPEMGAPQLTVTHALVRVTGSAQGRPLTRR